MWTIVVSLLRKTSRTISRRTLQVQAGAHDDVVDVRLGECGPGLIKPGGDELLDIRHSLLLVRVLDDDTQPVEQEHLSRQAFLRKGRVTDPGRAPRARRCGAGPGSVPGSRRAA